MLLLSTYVAVEPTPAAVRSRRHTPLVSTMPPVPLVDVETWPTSRPAPASSCDQARCRALTSPPLPLAGAAHTPSPRRNVLEDGAPLPRFAGGTMPVTSVARFT